MIKTFISSLIQDGIIQSITYDEFVEKVLLAEKSVITYLEYTEYSTDTRMDESVDSLEKTNDNCTNPNVLSVQDTPSTMGVTSDTNSTYITSHLNTEISHASGVKRTLSELEKDDVGTLSHVLAEISINSLILSKMLDSLDKTCKYFVYCTYSFYNISTNTTNKIYYTNQDLMLNLHSKIENVKSLESIDKMYKVLFACGLIRMLLTKCKPNEKLVSGVPISRLSCIHTVQQNAPISLYFTFK